MRLPGDDYTCTVAAVSHRSRPGYGVSACQRHGASQAARLSAVRVSKGQGHQALLDEEVQREPSADEDDVGDEQNAGEGPDVQRRQGVAVG